jgi:hypothetical protein
MGTARTTASCLNAGALELTECSSYVDNFVSGAAEASDLASDIFDGIALVVAALIVTADIYRIIKYVRRIKHSKISTREAISALNVPTLLQDGLILSTSIVGFAAPAALPFMLIVYQSFNVISLALEQKKNFAKKNKLEKEVETGLDATQLGVKRTELKQLKTTTHLETARIASGIAIVTGALLTVFPTMTDFGVSILGIGIVGLVTTAITKKAIAHYKFKSKFQKLPNSAVSKPLDPEPY